MSTDTATGTTGPGYSLGDWYVVHTYAGYENKVKANLQSRISSMNMEERIFEVVIPMEDVMEIKGGKKQVVSRKVFPGYLLVRMYLDDDSWYVVRNTPGVTGFVGSGAKPTPLSEKEVAKILETKPVEKLKPRVEWQVGESGYESRSSNSPWDGKTLQGRVRMTVAAGGVAYRERSFAIGAVA